MPWQRQVADVALELDPETGLYAYSTVIVTVQRQAGKTALTGAISTHRALTTKRGRIWYTAQTGKDAGDWMREEYLPAIAGSVFEGRYKSRLSQGSESVIWDPTQSVFRVFPPLRDALHGKQSDLVFVDEAWAHDEAKGDELKQAIRPTQATRSGAQTWILSTAGDASSVYLRSYVETGRAAVLSDVRRGVAYFEWSIPDDVDVDDLDRVAEHHPAVGFTQTVDFLRAARPEMKPGEFARAYGNRWTDATERVIPVAEWIDAALEGTAWTRPSVPIGLAFDVALDRSDAAITAAWRDTDDGPIRVDPIEVRPGTDWLAGRVKQLADDWDLAGPVGYDDAGPARDVADELRRAGLELAPIKHADYATACSAFLAAIVDGRLLHPAKRSLDNAAGAAAQKPVGDGGWVWSRRKSAGSISPLTAATVAMWTFDHRPEPEPPPAIYFR